MAVIILRRRQNWPERLSDVIAYYRAKPFEWGRLDCALFACNCILQMTNIDPAEWFRGRYDDEASARAAMAQYVAENADADYIAAHGDGLTATWQLVAAAHGLVEKSLGFAQRGDIVLLSTASGESLGVVDLDGLGVAFVDFEGLKRVALKTLKRAGARAWQVGR